MTIKAHNGNCLNTPEAAAHIGMSESWLRQRRMTGNLDGMTAAPPFVRIGRSVRYLRTELDRWLAQQSVNGLVGE